MIVHGRRLRELVAQKLGDRFHVALGMRYGEPSIGRALDELNARGCDDVLVLPLFPQYSNTTTGSVAAEVARVALRQRSQPNLAFVPPFYDHPLYI